MLNHFKKSLRQSQTDAENKIWYHLKNRCFQNYKFRRQHVLCGYIVDFVCLQKKLVIELDGGQHAEQHEYDLARTLKLEADGFQVLRFWNNEILHNMDDVLEEILQALSTPHPTQTTRRPRNKCGARPSPTRGEVKMRCCIFSH
jgi:very-short-patch-repair endonuclease